MYVFCSIRHLLVHAPHDSIVLLEDIDCLFQKRGGDASVPQPHSNQPYSPGPLSMSGLLNALDGE